MDFPAAHSMDTSWFGVDRDGRVALFSTGEDGSVPLPMEGNLSDPAVHVVLLAAHTVMGAAEELLDDPDPSEVGLYDYGGDYDSLYRRRSSPSRPLLLLQLPEDVRRRMPLFRMPELSFADKPILQLEEHAEDLIHYRDQVRCWYVSEDESMACARPGREAEFRALFQTDADWVPLHEARAREAEAQKAQRAQRARATQDRPWWPVLFLLMLLASALLWWLAPW
jgi:hypothetical protein